MTKIEAAKLVLRLATAFPSAKFSEDTAALYEGAIGTFDAGEAQRAVDELISTARFLPPIADIRSEVFRLRRAAADQANNARHLRLVTDTGDSVGPRPEAWSGALGRILEASSRHRDMAERWYRERGKQVPPDPMAPFIEVAKAGAKGSDVSDRFRSEVLPEDESERRYP